jgi:hypothetical protein
MALHYEPEGPTHISTGTVCRRKFLEWQPQQEHQKENGNLHCLGALTIELQRMNQCAARISFQCQFWELAVLLVSK